MSRVKYSAEEIIKQLQLRPLEREGGWFRLMYKSDVNIPRDRLPATFKVDHTCVSCIYYLLKKGEVSDLHMLSSDEMWFWLSGGTLRMRISDRDDQKKIEEILIGPDLFNENISYLVRGNKWQTTELVDGDYALVACVVTPSFDENEYFSRGESNV